MPEFGDLPIVAVSAGASGSSAKNSLAAGANAFLSKPIDFSELLSQIAALLNIEWNDEMPETQPADAGRTDVRATDPSMGTLVVPPREQMEALHHLARMGDMRAIVQHAMHLSELDERYRPFADHLCRLARDYRSKAILRFVEHYVARREVP